MFDFTNLFCNVVLFSLLYIAIVVLNLYLDFKGFFAPCQMKTLLHANSGTLQQCSLLCSSESVFDYVSQTRGHVL